jgi:hypothetical protein
MYDNIYLVHEAVYVLMSIVLVLFNLVRSLYAYLRGSDVVIVSVLRLAVLGRRDGLALLSKLEWFTL